MRSRNASLLLGATLLGACAPSAPYYLDSYTARPPVPQVHQGALLNRIEAALRSGKIRSLAADTGQGLRPLYPPPAGAAVPPLDTLPLPAVVAVDTALYARTRGAEWDQLVPESDGRRVPVTVLWELDGAMTVRVGPPLREPPPPPEAEEVRRRHGFKALEATDRAWAPAELQALDQALSRLSPAERRVLEGVAFKRRASSDCSEKSSSGCYMVRDGQRRIALYDSAFVGDPHQFIGEVAEPLPASAEVALHEVGHAIADGARALLWPRFDAAVSAYNQELDRSNAFLAECQRRHQQGVKEVAAINALIERGNRLPEGAEREAVLAEQKRLDDAYEAHLGELKAMLARHEARKAALRQQAAQIEAMRRQLNGAAGESLVLKEYLRVRGEQKGPTIYGRKDLSQSFAEAFALFRGDPAALRRIYPAVADWFQAGGHIAAVVKECGAACQPLSELASAAALPASAAPPPAAPVSAPAASSGWAPAPAAAPAPAPTQGGWAPVPASAPAP